MARIAPIATGDTASCHAITFRSELNAAALSYGWGLPIFVTAAAPRTETVERCSGPANCKAAEFHDKGSDYNDQGSLITDQNSGLSAVAYSVAICIDYRLPARQASVSSITLAPLDQTKKNMASRMRLCAGCSIIRPRPLASSNDAAVQR